MGYLKNLKRHTGKKIVAQALALAMCVTSLSPVPVSYAAGEGLTAETVPKRIWDFSDGTTQKWEYNDGWTDEDMKNKSSVEYEDGKLKFNVNFESQESKSWIKTAISLSDFTNVDLAGANMLSFDFSYNPGSKTTGGMSIQASIKGNGTENLINNNVEVKASQETSSDWITEKISFKLDKSKMTNTQATELVLAVVGQSTNYNGCVYFDNISLSQTWDFDENNSEIDWKESKTSGTIDTIKRDENKGMLEITFKNKFNEAEGWDEKGIGINDNDGMNFSGYDKMSFDFYYIPQKLTKGSIAIKVEPSELFGDNSSQDIVTYIEDTSGTSSEYKKVSCEFNLKENRTNELISGFQLICVGRNCDYSGSVMFDNITFKKSAQQVSSPVEQTILKSLYTFDTNLEGWNKDNGYTSANVKNEVTHDIDKLKMTVDYTAVNEQGWQNAGIYFENSDGSKLDFTPYNYLSFDLYYEYAKKTKGDLLVKVDANVDNKNLFGNQILNFNNIDFTDVGNGLKKAEFGFSIDQKLAETVKPDKIDILVVGDKTDYNGIVYIDNINFKYFAPEEVKNWDFAQDIGNWKYNNIDWKDGDVNFNGSVAYESAGQRLQTNVDFSQLSEDTWAQAGGISYSNEGGLSFSGKNQLSFDFYYPASLSGNITIKPVAEYKKGDKTKNLFVGDQSQSISGLVSEDAGNGLKKAKFEFVLDENNTEEALPNQLLLVLIGNSTNYKGAVYFDNIKVETIDRGYKYSTIKPNKTNTTLSTTDKALTINDETKTYIDNIKLVDDKANDETKALYQYLKAVGESSSVIYGHMEDTVLKAGNDSDEFKDSDTADVTDSISAIDGLDCGKLFDGFAKKYVDRYGEENSERVVVTDNTFEDDVKAAAAFSNKSIERGAIMTLSSHLPNFAHAKLKSNADSFTKSYDKYDYTGGNSYNLTGDCMNNILPGGKFNDAYTSYLDLIAEYAAQVDGPILFRPLHENTGSWFWWGKAFCDAETYKSVFKYTVDYLRDEKNVHNFLYLYGPGSEAASEEEYEERYPGDNYVDMVGFDSYDAKPTNDEKYVFMKNFENTVKLTNSFAQKHNKLFAVTETGISNDSLGLLPKGNPRKDWYKEILDIVTKADYNCCYFMLWSNYSSTSSYYTPFVVKKDEASARLYGHELLDKFIEFFNDKRTIFACHQEEIIKNFTTITKPIVAAKELDGYIIEPVANSRILNETTISAKFNMETDKTILIRASGNEKNIELKTVKDATGKVYTATLTKENLNALGKTADGKIGLYVDGKLYQEISVILNIEEKVMLPEQVDDFESYGGLANLLLGKWATNKDSGCTVDFSLVNDLCYEGEYALKFAYNETKTGWAGATISKEADWSAYDALKFWVKPDGKNQKTVIQINASEGTYEAYLNLYPEYANASTPLLVTLPFSEFKKNNGDVLTSEALKNMSGFGLWVNAIGDSAAFANGEETVSGELYYDDIRAVSAGTDKPIFEIAEGKKPEDTTTEVKENETEIKNNIGEASLSKTDFKNIQEDIKNDVVTALKDMLNNASTEDKEKVRKAIDAIESGQAFIDISLKVNEKSSGITDEDEKKENNIQIEDIRNEVQRNNNGSDVEVKVAVTLDISLFSICKDKKDNTEIARVALSKLTKPVKISMKLPANIPVVKNGAVRTYYIICLHKNKNGKIESSKVKCDYDKDSGIISFDGSKFSTYVLCYADITSKSTNTPSSGGSTISGGGTSVVLGSVTSTPVPTATPTAKPGTAASPAPSVTVTPTPVPSSTPSSTNAPSVTSKPSQTEQPSDEPSTSPSKVKKGTKFITKGITYRVTSVSGTKTVTCVSGKKNIKKAVVPASVKINGKKYKVTVIAKNAFKDNKKLTKVTIGKNVQSIGKNAFNGCKNLKKIIVKTKKLTAKKVGSNAFKGINSKAVVKVPKNKVKAYKKIIKAKGAGKKVKVIK